MQCLITGRQCKQYSPKLRAFAFTLHFYSPRAYKYVRSVFNNRLPSVSTIRKWTSSINGKPGFSQEALDVLKIQANEANKNGEEILACLIFDEIAIRQQEEYDQHTGEVIGRINYGTFSTYQNPNKLAKEALVFMITGVNKKFKIPVAYFLSGGIKADEKAALIQEMILRVSKTGVKIVGMTFDGLNTNLTTCRKLGADFDNDRAFIMNPHSDSKIFIYLDASHMLKLARNIWAKHLVLYDGNNDAIEWRFIQNLEKYQRENMINIGNKINAAHIQWDRKKMSVRIAAETLSNSAADAIDFLRSKNVEGFENSQPTTKYMRFVNNSFDILNSKVDEAIGFKRNISRETIAEYSNFIDEAIPYFCSLKFDPKKPKTIIKTRSKTAFFGFKMDLNNFRQFYKDYVESGILFSIPTFRFSQDHLELLFGCIRSMFGCNDNPSARHLESAWRKLLGQHQITVSEYANCANNDVEMLSVLNVSSRVKKTATSCPIQELNSVQADLSGIEFNPNEFDESIESEELSFMCSVVDEGNGINTIRNHVVTFTAGVIESCILEGRWYKRIKCEDCLRSFREDDVTDDVFVNTKMKTNNLRAPAKSTVRICMATEQSMERFEYKAGHLKDILVEVVSKLNPDTLFTASDFESHVNTNHKMELIKMIVEMYVKQKFDYITKCDSLNNHGKLYRHRLRKFVHFSGQ